MCLLLFRNIFYKIILLYVTYNILHNSNIIYNFVKHYMLENVLKYDFSIIALLLIFYHF